MISSKKALNAFYSEHNIQQQMR